LRRDGKRGDARQEDEVADRERGRIAGGRAPGQLLVLEVLDLEPRFGNGGHGLDVHIGAGQQQPLLRDRGRGRDAAIEKFAPHLLIGRHGFHRRVVLVGAHEIAAVGAGSTQYRIEILEDA
jgi:hypothetical protein